MDKTGKRFQSGREVFEVYIPEYRSKRHLAQAGEDEVAESVEAMLTRFGERMLAAQHNLDQQVTDTLPTE